MRLRFRSMAFDSIASHEILEFLLFYSQPRCNTNEIAHELIETFGSLPGVFEASFEELKKVNNVGDAAATLLCTLPQIFKRYCKEKENIRESYDTLDKLTHFCQSLFWGANEEQAYLLLFDNGMHIVDCVLLAQGTVNQVPLMTRKIAEKALEKHAACVVLTHNHPDGLPFPSDEDLTVTNAVAQALSLFCIPLLEHILVTNTECIPLLYRYQGLERTTSTESTNDGFLRAFYKLPKP